MLFRSFDLSKNYTPEEKYNSAITLLEQWNSEYARQNGQQNLSQISVTTAKLQLCVEKQQICLKKIEEIMESLYEDLKNTPVYKQLQKNLIEASKKFLYVKQKPLTQESINSYNAATTKILKTLSDIDNLKINKAMHQEIKQNFINTCFVNNNVQTSDHPTVYYKMSLQAKFKPKICENSNGLDLPIQESVTLQPYELKIGRAHV